MSIQAGVGLSREKDSYQAGYEACTAAIEKMGKEKPDLTIVFASVEHDQEELLKGVREVSGKAELIGCTDSGEITNSGPTKGGVGVMAIKSDVVQFHLGVGKDIKKGAREAGRAVAKDVQSKMSEEMKAFIMLPDVLVGNGADIVRGVLDVLGEHFPVVGGAAGDDFLFEKTYEYYNDDVHTGAVMGMGISGKFSMGAGVKHGWLPISNPRKVTKAEGSVLYELDGRPAVSIYEDYFGSDAEELRKEPLARMAITYPLGLKVPGLDEYLIRDPITVGEDGSLTCAAEIPEGSEIRLMIGSREKAQEAAEEAAHNLMAEFEKDGTKPKFILMFNCIAREKLFGARAKEEIAAVMNIIGNEVPLLGFYTYGEQAPMGGELRDSSKINARFYNETIVLFAIGE